MYILSTITIMLVLPIVSIVVERYLLGSTTTLASLIGRWFVFWGVGIRLLSAGMSQILRPQFTSQRILHGAGGGPGTVQIVQELGFANTGLGIIGIGSVSFPGWSVPGAVAGGIFFALAGVKHVMMQGRGRLENVAMVSDLVMALILFGYVLALR